MVVPGSDEMASFWCIREAGGTCQLCTRWMYASSYVDASVCWSEHRLWVVLPFCLGDLLGYQSDNSSMMLYVKEYLGPWLGGGGKAI